MDSPALLERHRARHPRRLAAGVAITMAMTAAHASAQNEVAGVKLNPGERLMAEPYEDRLGIHVPEAQILATMALTRRFRSLSLFNLSRVGKERRHAAHLVDRQPGGAETSRWADSRTCPQLREMVASVNRVVSPRARAWSALGTPQPPPMVDGTYYTLWSGSALQADGALASLAISANSGRFAEWAEGVFTRLEPCWTPEPPR